MAILALIAPGPAYLGPDVVYPPEQLGDQPGFATHIHPESISGIGPWSKRMF